MTIAAAYLTSEGVVLGTDSTTTVFVNTPAGAKVGQLLNNAQKIFEIGQPNEGRLAFATWGDGMIGETSHRTVGALLADKILAETTVEQAVGLLLGIVKEASGNCGTPDVGYFVGGTNPSSHKPECYKVVIGKGQTQVTPLKFGDAYFEGVSNFFIRAFHGIDPGLPNALSQALRKHLGTAAPSNFEEVFGAALRDAMSAIYTGWTQHLPLRDAIDFVHMYLHLTIKAFRFRLGPPICGGEIELGFVSTDRPFRWVRHKDFDSAI
jgi:hypothetical protein